jgi:hypothetical protein
MRTSFFPELLFRNPASEKVVKYDFFAALTLEHPPLGAAWPIAPQFRLALPRDDASPPPDFACRDCAFLRVRLPTTGRRSALAQPIKSAVWMLVGTCHAMTPRSLKQSASASSAVKASGPSVSIPRCRPEPRYSAGSPAIRNFASCRGPGSKSSTPIDVSHFWTPTGHCNRALSTRPLPT